MAIRNIVQISDDVLRKKSSEVKEFNEKLIELLDDMKDTLFACPNGAGLAAPQVGVLKRVFLVYVDNVLYEFINPKIVKEKGTQVGDEGCLSVKGKYGKVKRFMTVDVIAKNRYGEPFRIKASGFLARAIQHENDHLDGILFVDKAFDLVEEEN